ncbi:MAG: alpha-amylase family glycosyl hydrolase [Acutalibacteraceae bacterium]
MENCRTTGTVILRARAWQWDDQRQEYYLHLFAVKQPDLNMDNPLVRTEVKKILKFWLDLGVDGLP